MSIRQRIGAVIVALFAVLFTRAPAVIRLLNPVMRRVLRSPVPAGPNVLLGVRGRRSGVLRTSPVAALDLGDRMLLQAASSGDSWVSNLRVAGHGTITSRGATAEFDAIELDPATSGRMLHDLLAANPRSKLVRTIVGRTARPPVGVLAAFGLRVDDRLEEYVALARRQPVFDLRPRAAG